MSARPWFRMHAEAVDDEKLRLLAFEDRWHFVALLCLKAQGTLDSAAPRLEQRIALKLGLQLAQLDELKRRLTEIGLIDETFQPVSWGKRQYESDSSTERVRKHRAEAIARKQATENKGETSAKRPGNVSVAPSEQNRTDTEQSREEGARAAVPRGTSDAGNALCSTPTAEAVLDEHRNAWRDVGGCDGAAMTEWLKVWSRVHGGREMPSYQRIATAKLLAVMGDAETQMRAVLTAAANGWKALRPGDGRKPLAPKGSIDQSAKAESESREWIQLAERAKAIGFRPATAADDLIGYRTLVERAENSQPRGRRVMSVSGLLSKP